MRKLSNFKALLFDVDNTLTNQKRVVSKTVVTALQELVKRGYKVGVCTGKGQAALITPIMPYFPPTALHVTCGGAQVTTSTNQIKWHKVIPHSIATQVGTALIKENAGFFVYKEHGYYITSSMREYFAAHAFKLPYFPLEELTDWTTSLIGVYNFTTYLRTQLEPWHLHLAFKEIPHYHLQSSYVDITPTGVTKATGLMKWCQLQDTAPSQVIGFGDSENDLEFLTEVGYAVAMGNATPNVKKLANRIIDHTDNDGLGTYLTNLLEGAPL